MKIEITINGKEITATAYTESKIAKGVAKCNPKDQFDLATGAKLAIDRVCEQLRPYLSFSQPEKVYGFIGELTSLCDIEGLPLCVGDTVTLYARDDLFSYGETVVCKEDNEAFVMGVAGTTFTYGYNDYWFIVKKRNHTDIKDGEKVSGVMYHKPQL